MKRKGGGILGNYFSKNLKFLREAQKISKSKLAKMVGVNQSTISRWETNDMTPSIDNVEEVAKVLNIELPDLLIKDLSNPNSEPLTTKKENDFKRIFKDKGLLDDNDNLTEEDAKKLIDFAIANKDFIIKKREN